MATVVVQAPISAVGSHTAQTNLSSDQTLTVPAGADGILLQAITQNVRIRLDGSAATTSVGFQIKAGDQPTLIQVTAGHIIHMIEEAATASLQSQAVAFGTGTFT